LEAPGTIAVNAGLSKNVQVSGRVRLRFEATFTNVLDHVNFAPPSTNVSSPSTFGVLESAQTADCGGNRTGQLALRLNFEFQEHEASYAQRHSGIVGCDRLDRGCDFGYAGSKHLHKKIQCQSTGTS